MPRKSAMIDEETYVRGQALSFEQQPYLKLLFDHVRDTSLPLTIVAGAGVSINAGLPTWPDLIKHMAERVEDEGFRKIVTQDGMDPMRKAEIILALAKAGDRRFREDELIRDALYPQSFESVPGALASSIARLVATRRGNVRLLTTNFDTMLKDALRDYMADEDIQLFSIEQVEQWQQWPGVGVLHLHGAVLLRTETERGDGRIEPIVLSESQFLKYGEQVRAAIAGTLHGACALFVGLSVADPNLVGPLYASRDEPGEGLRFTLTVPSRISGVADGKEAARYAIASARYFEDELGLKPIFLKSYTQLNQVVSDLALAVCEPKRYPHRTKAQSLHYGNRLAKVLDDCYRTVGCTTKQLAPAGQVATQALSNRLHKALEAGPLKLMRDLCRVHEDHDIGGADGENFALFLWLRTRQGKQNGGRYSLSLVGSSAYAHRDEWFVARREAEIGSDSQLAVAQSVFYGNVQVDPAPDPPWQGVVAIPIEATSKIYSGKINGMPLDILTVGTLALHSTYRITTIGRSKANTTALPKGLAAGERVSLVSKMKSDSVNELLLALTDAANAVLWPK
jgi:hypothetical protein